MWTDHRRLLGALVASLLLNVFLFGILFGQGVAQRRERQPGAAGGPLVSSSHVEALPADQRQIFRDAMTSHRERIRTARQTRRELRAKVEADIAAPSFDRDRVAADFAALHQSNRVIEQTVSAALIDALAGLSQQSRAALVARDGVGPEATRKHP